MTPRTPLLTASLALFCLAPASHAQHQYRYDGPQIQHELDELEAGRGTDYLPLQPGATLTSHGRLITVTAVHTNGAALKLEGTIKNLTASTVKLRSISMSLNESPARQAKWFKAHPVTPEYHYGPGWNSHYEVQASAARIAPGRTGTFHAVWPTASNSIAAEPPADLVVLLDF